MCSCIELNVVVFVRDVLLYLNLICVCVRRTCVGAVPLYLHLLVFVFVFASLYLCLAHLCWCSTLSISPVGNQLA